MRDFDQEVCRAFRLLNYDLSGRWSGGERVKRSLRPLRLLSRCVSCLDPFTGNHRDHRNEYPTQGWLWLEDVTWNAAVQSARRLP